MNETLNTIALLGAIACGSILFWALHDFLRKGAKLFDVAKAYLLSPRNVNVMVSDKVAEELKRMFSL